jgi:DNA-binding PadR family transcriptional regulator
MTNKEIILDALINDSEAITQIKEYFHLLSVEISLEELNVVLEDLVEDEFIFIDEIWVNELGEKPYTITDKGKQEWEKIR